MYDVLKPFLRVLMVAPLMFCFGYLSFFTPYRLLQGEGFTDDLQLALVVVGIFAGLLYFSKPRKEIELFHPDEEAPGDITPSESAEEAQSNESTPSASSKSE